MQVIHWHLSAAWYVILSVKFVDVLPFLLCVVLRISSDTITVTCQLLRRGLVIPDELFDMSLSASFEFEVGTCYRELLGCFCSMHSAVVVMFVCH